MNFEKHASVNDGINTARWHLYKRLELVPDSTPIPTSRQNPLASGLNFLWRSLLSVLVDELVEEQRVEYLDRCWARNAAGDETPSHSLRRLWVLME